MSPGRGRSTRRERTVDALACLALSTLCFSQARSETLLRADWDFYNRTPLGAPTLLALVLSIVALAAVGFLGVQAVRRVRRRAWRRLAAATAAAALLISLNFVRITHETVGRWTDAIGHPGLLALVVLMLAASLGWPRPALRATRGLALVASPLAVVTLAHALWMFLEVAAGPVWRRADPEPFRQTAPSLRRVVWLVFDELDQRITFEARPAGLELPELDRLRRESLYADAARPPAGTTEISMPALITGRPVVAVAPTSPNDLELTFADGKAARWSAHPNVFSRARVLGYDTALIGWRLPYPRVLGGSLGVADWRPAVAYEQARGATFDQALRNQWGSLVPPTHVRRLLSQRLAELGDLAIRTAADGRFGLVLLHLPVPRPPGIYDRATGRLTTWHFTGAVEGYLDNLALADRVIAELRRSLERAHLGDRTWIVVSSDRWWQASKHYDGQVDHRVPFLVRPPDGGRAAHVDAPFSTLATHDLVLAILRGSIDDTGDAAAWLARQPVASPRDYTNQGRPIY
ncbi:MAG: sulfatase-like hydrolase/transferase [Candidatus Rokuibacteriota bacterium]